MIRVSKYTLENLLRQSQTFKDNEFMSILTKDVREIVSELIDYRTVSSNSKESAVYERFLESKCSS